MAKRVRLNRGFGRPVLLALAQELAAAGVDAAKPVWIQVASEGKYRGHPDFPVVDFSRPVFDTIVANFRTHPSFKAGANGYGTERVVPFDYEHASEMNPTQGSIPQKGAPAPAWALDLEVRDGTDGRAELWSLTLFGDTVREQIRKNEYQWTSVAVWPNARDPVTGDPVGPKLTSIAFTNHPFVEGMVPIAATIGQWGRAETPDEALIGLREIFGLAPDALPEFVASEIQSFAMMLAGGTLPEGIDVESIIGRMRALLGLRTLATRDEIFGEAGRFLSALLSDPNQAPPAGSQENATMSTAHEQLIARLATLFSVTEKEPTLLGGAILAAAKDAKESGNALEKLRSLFASPDVQSVLTDAASLVAQAKEMEGLTAALADAAKMLTGATEAKKEDQEQAAAVAASVKATPALLKLLLPILTCAVVAVRQSAEADAEADAVCASFAAKDKDMAERMRPIIVDARRACMGNPAKLEDFRKRFPLDDNARAYLKARVLAGPNGEQRGGAATGFGAPSTGTIPSNGGDATTPTGTAGPVDAEIAKFSGRNRVEKAIACLKSKDATFKDLEWNEQCRRAGRYLQTGQAA